MRLPRMTTRRWMVAVAIAGLVLGFVARRSRLEFPHIRIRVFNKTSGAIDRWQFQWHSLVPPKPVGFTVTGGGRASSLGLAPRGMESFEVEFSGKANFTLSCKTSNGVVTSGPVRIDVGRGSPTSLDFDVTSSGVKATIVGSGW
jgi:hypothetical protein